MKEQTTRSTKSIREVITPPLEQIDNQIKALAANIVANFPENRARFYALDSLEDVKKWLVDASKVLVAVPEEPPV